MPSTNSGTSMAWNILMIDTITGSRKIAEPRMRRHMTVTPMSRMFRTPTLRMRIGTSIMQKPFEEDLHRVQNMP